MARLAFELSELRVLLVEDDTFARELEKTALQHLGVGAIAVATNGEEALRTLKSDRAFDVIVSDWNMPKVDGLKLLKAVRNQWPDSAFVMVTNNEGLDQIRVAMEAGVDSYLIKPFSLSKLREMIQLALATRLAGGEKIASPRKKGEKPKIDKNLEKIFTTIEGTIAKPSSKTNGRKKTSGAGNQESLKNANQLAEKLSGQLNGFLRPLVATDSQQLRVIQLHVDCMRAVLSGREDLLAHETRNLIVDGLNVAIDMVSE